MRIQTAAKGNSLNLPITPLTVDEYSLLKIKPEILWGKKGVFAIAAKEISAKFAALKLNVYTTGTVKSSNDSTLTFSLSEKVGLTTVGKLN